MLVIEIYLLLNLLDDSPLPLKDLNEKILNLHIRRLPPRILLDGKHRRRPTLEIERERERACVSGGVGNLRNLFRRNAITWRSPNEDFALVYLRSPSGDQKDMSITIPEGLHEEVDQQIHWYLEK